MADDAISCRTRHRGEGCFNIRKVPFSIRKDIDSVDNEDPPCEKSIPERVGSGFTYDEAQHGKLMLVQTLKSKSHAIDRGMSNDEPTEKHGFNVLVEDRIDLGSLWDFDVEIFESLGLSTKLLLLLFV
jgi:hypothetical protein